MKLLVLSVPLAMLVALGAASAMACDEECAPGFYFDDEQATCIRITTS
jgi:hypothetical protein